MFTGILSNLQVCAKFIPKLRGFDARKATKTRKNIDKVLWVLYLFDFFHDFFAKIFKNLIFKRKNFILK